MENYFDSYLKEKFTEKLELAQEVAASLKSLSDTFNQNRPSQTAPMPSAFIGKVEGLAKPSNEEIFRKVDNQK